MKRKLSVCCNLLPDSRERRHMAFLLIAMVLVVAVVLLLKKRESSSQPSPKVKMEASYAIQATPKQITQEKKSKEEIMWLLEARIVASGFFRPEKIQELMAQLWSGSVPFGRTNTKAAFEGDVALTVERKRALGLNTRMKYTEAFIQYFEPSAFQTIEPKTYLENMHQDVSNQVFRKNQLIEFRELRFVKQVEICTANDVRDCQKVKRLKKIHDLDEVPELPLQGCDAAYCRCFYQAVIADDR
jgi:hypothetical protein